MGLESIKNDKVREYMRRKLEKEGAVEDAENVQTGVGLANVAGNIMNNYSNSQDQGVMLENKFSQLGSNPTVVGGQDKQYDDSSNQLADQGLARADKELAGLGPEPVAPTIGEEEDPNSSISRMAQEAFNEKHPGKDVSTMSFSQLKSVAPMYADKLMKGRSSRGASGGGQPKPMTSLEYRQEEDLRGREVPGMGTALTKGDASTLKDAAEMKSNFDLQIDEMLALRKKHNGGAIFAREDVARGQQLSKQLLLSYKNLAKLGVLSAADESIINAIIPADPLAYSAAGLLGGDPISHKLRKFKSDSDAQFKKSQEMRLQKKQEAPVGDDYDGMSDEELAKALKGS